MVGGGARSRRKRMSRRRRRKGGLMSRISSIRSRGRRRRRKRVTSMGGISVTSRSSIRMRREAGAGGIRRGADEHRRSMRFFSMRCQLPRQRTPGRSPQYAAAKFGRRHVKLALRSALILYRVGACKRRRAYLNRAGLACSNATGCLSAAQRRGRGELVVHGTADSAGSFPENGTAGPRP